MKISKMTSKKSGNGTIILLFLIAASTLAVKINYFSPKKFQATAQLKLKEKICENHPGKLTRIKNNPLSKAVTYDAILKSAVIDGVKNKNLNVVYFQANPLFRTELYNSSPITVTYCIKNENFYKQKFNFKYTGENNFTLSYETDGVPRGRAGEFGKEIHETDLKFTVTRNSKINPSRVEFLLSKNIQFTISTDEAMADNLLKTSINISSSVENGTTSVSVTSGVSEKSMLLANTISEAILRKTNSANSLAEIDLQLEKITAELEKERKELKGETTQNRFSHSNTLHPSYENLEAQKKTLEFQSIVLENLSDTLRKNRKNYNTTTNYGSINDPLIAEYITALNERIIQKNNASAEEALRLTEEIDALQSTVADVVRNTRKKIALQQDRIYNLLATTDNNFKSVPPKTENNLSVSNQNVYLAEKLYNYVAEKKTEMQGTILLSASSFIQKATLPRNESNANATVIWILFLLFGLITGCMAVFIRNIFLRKTGSDNTIVKGQNVISYLATIDNRNKKDTSIQFREICTKMLLLRKAEEKQIFTITSCFSGEGKSFISNQIARSLALLDLKVLVLDMNLRNPSVEENFDARSEYSLTDVLQKQIALEEAIQITSIPGIDILTAGNFPHGINSLVATNGISKVLTDLKSHYDVILIDSSDITSSFDAIPCMKFSNSTLFIGKHGADEKSIMEKTEQIKTQFEIDNIFFIKNNLKQIVKQKQKTTTLQTQNKDKEMISTKTPFLKRVALWFY